MKHSAQCPDEKILKAVVLGEINEPLLDYYLDHIDGCHRCAEIIDKSSWPQLEFQELINRSHLKKADLKPTPDNVDSAWLESLKKNFPARDFIPANNPDNALGLPEVIGNYRLTNLLGDGATSIVYQAVDMNLHREVALKILHPEFDNHPELQESILSEARAIASLSHENILPIFHIEKLGSNPVLVFPLLAGCTLQKALDERDFSLRETLEIVRDICRALQYIHSRGIIHRDIKPSNIWLGKRADGGNLALLFDFGFVGLEQNRSGTSGYMAPEQIRHEKNTIATDMFALGSLLFQLAGKANAPEKLKRIIHQLLAENPTERPTATQLLSSLDALLHPKRSLAMALGVFSLATIAVLVLLKNPWGGLPAPAPVEKDATQKNAHSKNLRPAVTIFRNRSGMPSALSGDGKIFVRHKNQKTLEYLQGPDERNPLEVPLSFAVATMELNSNGTLLAMGGSKGELQILKMPEKAQLHFSRVDTRLEKLAWAGRNSNILVSNLAGKPYYLQPEKGTDSYPQKSLELPAILSKAGNNPVLKDFCAQPMGGLMSLQFSNEVVKIWSFEQNQMVQTSPTLDKTMDFSLGWRSPEVYCMYQGRKVIEIESTPENTQKSKQAKVMDIWELPSTALDVCWLDKTNLVVRTDLGESGIQLLVGKRASRHFVAEFDTGSAFIQKLKPLDTPGKFAAFAAAPSSNIFVFDVNTPPVR